MSRPLLALCTAITLLTAAQLSLGATLGSAEQAMKKGDYAAAISALQPLAKDNDARAQFLLGQVYQQGLGVDADPEQAQKLFDQSARQGNLDAVNALREMRQAQYREQLPKIQQQAKAGDGKAQNQLGEMYEYGRGVKRDPAQALEWYRQAAEQNVARAWLNLGRAYNFGQGVTQNDAEAERWYRKAAAAGDSDAMFFLGTLYATGHGTDTTTNSDVMAYAWLKESSAHGNNTAGEVADRLKMKLDSDQLSQAEQQVNMLQQSLAQP